MKEMKITKENKEKKSIFSIFLIIIDILALGCFFVVYGPYSFFRDWFVTTAMTTMSHKYFAYTLYSEKTIEKVLDENKIIESEDPTDTSKISFNADFEKDSYESIYEEQVLKRDEGNDIYKVVDIEGDTWNGKMVVVYDPSKLQLVFSSKYGSKGEYLSTMAERNNALVAMNASGVYHPNGQNRVTGTAILNGKVYAKGKDIYKGGGLIGFTKDNILMLTKKSANEAIADGMDRAVEFGPFLIVNGVTPKFNNVVGGYSRAARVAIAQRKDGIVLFLVTEGTHTAGPNMKEVIDTLELYGAYNAANLDGGTSSQLVINNKLINHPKNIMGKDVNGGRGIVTGWGLFLDSNEKKS